MVGFSTNLLGVHLGGAISGGGCIQQEAQPLASSLWARKQLGIVAMG